MGLVSPNPDEHVYTASFNLMGKPRGSQGQGAPWVPQDEGS